MRDALEPFGAAPPPAHAAGRRPSDPGTLDRPPGPAAGLGRRRGRGHLARRRRPAGDGRRPRRRRRGRGRGGGRLQRRRRPGPRHPARGRGGVGHAPRLRRRRRQARRSWWRRTASSCSTSAIADHYGFTEDEVEILPFYAQGRTTRTIAQILGHRRLHHPGLAHQHVRQDGDQEPGRLPRHHLRQPLRGAGSRPAPGPAPTASSSSDAGRSSLVPRPTSPRLAANGTEQRPRSRQEADAGPRPQPAGQAQGLHLLPRPHRLRGLQGRQPAAPVHQRPGQDQGPPHHRHVRPAPARRGRGHQDGPRGGAHPLHPAHGERQGRRP